MRKAMIGVCLAALTVAGCESIGLDDGGTAASVSALSAFQQSLRAEAGDRVFFTTGSSTLDQRGRAILDRQVTWLEQNGGVRVRVEGHTDHRGSSAFNNSLGQRRANTVRSYLISRGIGADRVAAVTLGESRPAARPTSAAALAQNRRSVTMVQIAAGGAPATVAVAAPVTPQAGVTVAEPLPLGQTTPPAPTPAAEEDDSFFGFGDVGSLFDFGGDDTPDTGPAPVVSGDALDIGTGGF